MSSSDAKVFFESLKDKSVTVLGCGVSNRPLVEMLLSYKAKVKVCDKKDRASFGDFITRCEALGASFCLGEDYMSHIEGDIIIKTPGMRNDKPELIQAKKQGSRITSEMELFFDLCPCKKIAVTGSDGKTTTTTLIYNLLTRAGYKCHLGGNIGKPLLPEIFSIKPDDFAVVELSSFQLHPMRMSGDISVVKNVTPNHLDWHTGMDEYIDSKKNVYRWQDSTGLLILNADDPVSSQFSAEANGQVRWFSMKKRVPCGAFLDDLGRLIYTDGFKDTILLYKSDIRLKGDHNCENYLTAAAAVMDFVSPEIICSLAKEFEGVEHRMEYVRTFEGVEFYNDAIATSPTRSIACLKAQNRRIIMIAGGYDKHVPFEPLAPYINEKVKVLVLYGATSEKIEDAVRNDSNFDETKLKILHAKSMEDAVVISYKNSLRGDSVWLSPASASFDRYPNFEICGKDFKDKVNHLEKYLSERL